MAAQKIIIEYICLGIEAIGIIVVVLGMLTTFYRAVHPAHRSFDLYSQVRRDLGRSILLGLEFLVAADIIRTVAIVPTLKSALVLGVIVLIRTFLSTAIEVEIEGEWPWNRNRRST